MLSKVLDLRPGEARVVAPAMAVASLVVGAQVLATIASDTVFVTAFDLGSLSSFIVVASIARAVLTFAYGGLARRAHGRAWQGVALALVGIGTAGLGVLLRAGSGAVVYAACVALLIVPVAASDAVSGVAESFPARQGKRLVPLVAASSSVGGMVAGGAARALAVRIGTPSLLWLAGALLVAGAVASRAGRIGAREPRGGGIEGGVGAFARDMREAPVVRVAVGLALLVALTSSLADFLFKATLKAHFARDEMAAYVGVFEAALSAAVVVGQLFVAARVTGRYGIRAALQLYPAAVALVTPAFAIAPRVATATATKLAESFVRFSIVTPMRSLLIAPLDAAPRNRASMMVRGLAVPLGGVLAGAVLGQYGVIGPGPRTMSVLLALTAGLTMAVLAMARRAYAQALARSLGEGRLSLDIPPAQAAALHNGLRVMLRDAERAGDVPRALQALSMLGDAATREDVEHLLAGTPPVADAALEQKLLEAARRLGVPVDPARLEHTVGRTSLYATATGAALRFEALATGADADGTLGNRLRAAVDEGLASKDAHVFAAAATAAVRMDAPAYVARLVDQLVRGPHFGAAGRALALAGESAMEAVLATLPEARSRAGRVLARLGPRACGAVLERWPDLDHRTRAGAAKALAIVPDRWREAIDGAAVQRAIDATLSDAEALVRAQPSRGSPVLARELRLRIAACAEQAVDLAAVLGDRARIGKARGALARTERARADALELLEEVLPRPFARRTLSILEVDGAGAARGDAAGLDAWLRTCAGYDRGELSSPPMEALFDKLVVLGESSLFAGMTSEELYPLGQLATVVELEAGQPAVSQGDPGDAVFVVESGTLEIVKDGRKLREVSRGAVFGEMALLDGGPRSASVNARTRSRVLRIPRAEFDALLDEYPEIARGIIRTLLGHLRA